MSTLIFIAQNVAEVLDKPFATTVVGQVVIPALSTLVGAGLVGGFIGLRKVLTRIDMLGVEVTSIKHEVHPNSGTSLKDAVLRIESEQTSQGQRLDAHIEQGRYDLQRLDAALNGKTPPPPKGGSS